MELLPLEYMLVIMVLVTTRTVFLTHVRANKSTTLLPLLDMELDIGWSRIPGVTTGEMAATSRLQEENQNVVLVEIAHWWNVQRQELLHQPHKLQLRPLFQQIKFVTLAACMETPTSREPTHCIQPVCTLNILNLLT